MAALADHSNVIDTAIDVLQRKGFQVWHDKEQGKYCAERDGWDFVARSPVSLLGLVAIFEATQPESWREYWWKSPRTSLHEALPDEPRPYAPIFRRDGSR